MSLQKIIKRLFIILVMSGFSSCLVAGISTTKHNLSVGGSGTIKANAGELNEEICAYCHTPHGASSTMNGAPLWNKGTVAAASFTLYGASSAGTAGTTIAGTSTDTNVNAQSLACLSCHDGVSAINSVVNAPGSGGYNGDAGANALFNASTGDKLMPAGITAIGQDLRNDHPVSITYTVGAASLRATNYSLTGWEGASTVADLLRGSGADKVECGSCHDPHSSTNATFLRKTNAASALCLGCHDK